MIQNSPSQPNPKNILVYQNNIMKTPFQFFIIFSLIQSSLFSQSNPDLKSVIEALPIISENEKSKLQKDWLIDSAPFKAKVSKSKDGESIILHNGLVSRTIQILPNAATTALDNLTSQTSFLRGVKPEAEVTVNGTHFKIGGLIGQSNYAFLRNKELKGLKIDSNSMIINKLEFSKTKAPFGWKKVRHHAQSSVWPPAGVAVKMDYDLPGDNSFSVSVHYEFYDGIPVFCKWLTLQNNGSDPIVVNKFVNELIAAVEYESRVEDRGAAFPPPNIHVETDYAFGGMTVANSNRRSVHWELDPQYASQVNYLRNTPCLLKTYPELGPEQTIAPGDSFTSFRTYVMPLDSYDRERNGLAKRRMYRTIAPWTTENPLMMHVRFADWESVKTAIDQCAEVGFEMVILTFGSGFNMEDDSPEYLAKMKQYAEYAQSRGMEIGGYSLLASRSIGKDQDVVMPEGKKATFGNSPCLESEWGQDYFQKLYQFYEKTGFFLLEHDGNYPGDECLSTNHPGHKGGLDSRWNQWRKITNFYKWCRENGIYLNVPDYYYLAGSNKCGMGYREVNWSLPRADQVIHTRQNIYDGTWDKLGSMGWMFVPLTEYHGGGAAATIEPLHEHRDHYKLMMVSNLGAGVQACYRGPRLFDTDATKALVRNKVSWYKQHREVLEGDLIHLKRADGRNLDYWMTVNPGGKEKALLMVFNPLPKSKTQNLTIPLYYSGLSDQTKLIFENGSTQIKKLNRNYELELNMTIPANGYSWVVFEEG